jgi:hypothetical protein
MRGDGSVGTCRADVDGHMPETWHVSGEDLVEEGGKQGGEDGLYERQEHGVEEG